MSVSYVVLDKKERWEHDVIRQLMELYPVARHFYKAVKDKKCIEFIDEQKNELTRLGMKNSSLPGLKGFIISITTSTTTRAAADNRGSTPL